MCSTKVYLTFLDATITIVVVVVNVVVVVHVVVVALFVVAGPVTFNTGQQMCI